MSAILSMIWRLLKIYGGKVLELLYKLFKAQLRAILWKYGTMVAMIVLTALLAYFVLAN